MSDTFRGVMLPFLGTVLGSSCVFLMKKSFDKAVVCILTGFAAGVMTAASVWSLILPAISQSEEKLGKLAFIPASCGFMTGVAFLLILDKIIPHLHKFSTKAEGMKSHLSPSIMLILAVTLHNLPEGMAVGAVFAGLNYGNPNISLASALALSFGIAVQNFPEGAIISLPLHAEGTSKPKAFLLGVLSGAIEPLGALITIIAAGLIIPALPFCLSFAAGAMIYVVVEELIPELSSAEHSDSGTIAFSLGFVAMMVLDVAFG